LVERTALGDVPGPVEQAEMPARRFPWWVAGLLLWSVLLAGWTCALLRPEPVQVARAVLPEQAEFPVSKLLHVSAYAVLAALVVLLRPLGHWRWLLLALLSLHGMGTEYLQQFVELRGPAVRDVLLDHLGIVLGAAAAWRNWLKG
jgi:VanZ family protein